MKEFCPRCGKETGPFIRGFCSECLLEKVKLVEIPAEIEIQRCKHCKRIRIEGKWKPQSNWLLIDAVTSKIKGKELVIKDTEIELFPLENGNTIANAKIIGSIDSKALVLDREVLLKEKASLCDDCSRIAGSYFEATIQIRFSKKPTQEEIEKKMMRLQELMKQQKKKRSLAEITKLVKDRYGFDALIGDKKSAKIVAERMANATTNPMKVSSTLVGLDRNGVEKYRFTFLVRF
jgi:nonsense-mediated mRNA decay protein 3